MAKNEDELSQLLKDVLYCGQEGLTDDIAGRGAMRVFHAGVADQFIRDLFRARVRKHKIAQAFAGPFPLPKLHRGKIILGLDAKGRAIRMPLQSFNCHALCLAGSGAGKTVMLRWLALQIAARVKCWLFDVRKREMGILQPYLARLGVNLGVVRARQLRLNLLQVPSTSPQDWAPHVAQILVMVLELPSRASKLIHSTILVLYRDFGVLEGSRNYPTLFDLREHIAADRNANPQAKHAVVDSLDPVLLSIGEVLRWRMGWTTSDLAKRHLVFELDGVSEVDKSLILNTLIFSEFTSRIARGVSNVPMDLWIACDEAARLISTSDASESLSNLIGLVRGTGVGLWLATQTSDIAQAILSNTANKFIGRCGSSRDFDCIGSAIGLNAEQRQYLSHHLRPGLFAGQVAEGDWRYPFILRVPPLNLSSLTASGSKPGSGPIPLLGGCSSSCIADLNALPTVEAREFRNWRPEGVATPSAGTAAEGDVQTGELSEAELRFLKTVVSEPGQPSSVYPALARVSTKRAKQIRQRLVELGYLREHRVASSSSGRGRTAIILEPLEAAFQLIEQMGDGKV